mmetsp:Transcript_19819/g.19826  ORF Transcript_19819/g.19826 Transcript_19819/m.19826 type:complete len:118 (-) Transcript_19819:305-658(-)
MLAFNSFEFIKPRHLDILIPPDKEIIFTPAIEHIQNINKYTSPRDKLVCISNCFRIINKIISSINEGSVAHGADESLPMFVYVVLKSKTPKLFSNYYYIKRFRYPPRIDHRDNVEFR